jgi:group I intron endonuclease
MCGIYKIQNSINGKIYIGQSVDIYYRFRNHKSESFNPKSNAYDTAIHRAIRKYGVENFSFDIIEECSQDELREREIYWINYYGSFGDGYNLTTGGEGVPTVNIKQVQNLWDEGLSIDEIATTMNCDKHTTIRILESYEKYSNEESYKRGRKNASAKISKPVVQYDNMGVLIKKYNSATDAEQQTGIKANDIRCAALGCQASAGGYQWIYDGDSPPGIYNPKSSNDKKPVFQFDLQGNFIAEYSSASEAQRAVGLKNVNSITRCCENNQHTAAGYFWKWKLKNVTDAARTKEL